MEDISRIKRELILLGPVDVICHPKIQRLCLRPYFNHPKGCPNYGRKDGCPPKIPLFLDIFDKKAYIAAVVFNFGDYLALKRKEHPDWTERALRNSRHWQGHLRSELKRFVSEKINSGICGEVAIFNPEGMGVNVTGTCKKAGLNLEWPPKKIVCQIALIGQVREYFKKDYFKVVTHDLKSIGLLNASQIQYKIGEWVYPAEPLSSHYYKGGGLWVYSKRSDAFNGKRYVEKNHGIKCRVFSCKIGIILNRTPETFYRVKTDKVMLLEEIQKAT